MIKKRYKVIAWIMLIITLVMIIPVNYSQSTTITNPIEAPGVYKPEKNDQANNTKFIELGNQITGILKFLGTLVMVVSIMIIGIKYMIASTGEKATYKETMIPYLIGAIMVFVIPQVVGIIYDIITTAF